MDFLESPEKLRILVCVVLQCSIASRGPGAAILVARDLLYRKSEHHVIISSHAFLGLTKFGGLFSRLTSMFILSDVYLTVLLLSYTSSE